METSPLLHKGFGQILYHPKQAKVGDNSGDNKSNFDILHSQLDGNFPKNEIPKEKPVEKNLPPVSTPPAQAGGVAQAGETLSKPEPNTMKNTREENKYKPNQTFLSFIDELIASSSDKDVKRRLKVLRWDMDFMNSEEQTINVLKRHQSLGSLKESEFEKAKSLLVGSEVLEKKTVEEKKQNNISVSGSQTKEIPVAVEIAMSGEDEEIHGTEEALSLKRNDYTGELVNWRNELRGKKQVFNKLVKDLGKEKIFPKIDPPKSLENTKKSYIATKRKRNSGISGGFSLEVLLEEERDRDIITRKVLETSPDLEKKVLSKSLDKWRDLSPKDCLSLSQLFLFGDIFIFDRKVKIETPTSKIGKFVDGIFKKKNETEPSEKIPVIDLAKFSTKEKELFGHLENLDTKIKKQNLARAFNIAGHTSYSMEDKEEKPNEEIVENDLPEEVVEEKVENSNIVTQIQNIKADIINKYGEIENVPENIKNSVLNKSSNELLSELGLNREEAGVVLELDEEKGAIVKQGEEEVSEIPELEVVPQEKPSVESVVDNANPKTIVFTEGDKSFEIAREAIHDGKKRLVLDNKYQDDEKWLKIREFFTKKAEELDESLSKCQSIPFMGGKVYIDQDTSKKPNEVRVSLNGRVFARGIVGEKGPEINLIDEKEIKGSWFLADTVYEKAWKTIKKDIKDLKMK